MRSELARGHAHWLSSETGHSREVCQERKACNASCELKFNPELCQIKDSKVPVYVYACIISTDPFSRDGSFLLWSTAPLTFMVAAGLDDVHGA